MWKNLRDMKSKGSVFGGTPIMILGRSPTKFSW